MASFCSNKRKLISPDTAQNPANNVLTRTLKTRLDWRCIAGCTEDCTKWRAFCDPLVKLFLYVCTMSLTGGFCRRVAWIHYIISISKCQCSMQGTGVSFSITTCNTSSTPPTTGLEALITFFWAGVSIARFFVGGRQCITMKTYSRTATIHSHIHASTTMHYTHNYM